MEPYATATTQVIKRRGLSSLPLSEGRGEAKETGSGLDNGSRNLDQMSGKVLLSQLRRGEGGRKGRSFDPRLSKLKSSAQAGTGALYSVN